MDDFLQRSDGEEEELRELILVHMAMLLALAGRRIRNKCSDPPDHKRDVVQQGITKFLQAVRKREVGYDSPAKVLRSSVWQEAVRHSQTCLREQAVDFNQLHNRPAEPEAFTHVNRSPRALDEATSFNPSELLGELVDLSQRLSGVSDQDLFIRYFVLRETLNEIARARNCATMTVHRAVKNLLKELGIQDEQWSSTVDPEE